MKFLVCVAALVAINFAFADSITKSFKTGSGSKFQLSIAKGLKAEMLVYVTESSDSRVGIETYLSTKATGLPIELWQQTRVKPEAKSISILDAFLFSQGFAAPEKMDVTKVKNQGGLEMADFLFSEGSGPDKNKIGEESIQTAAGTMKATHFRQQRGTQTIDYWVSDEARPIGLVRLNSTGKQPFQIELSSLLKNVKRKIDPAKAVPLSEKGKALLSFTGGMGLMP